MKLIHPYLYIIFSAIVFCSCSPEQFNDEKPFSVKIASFREYDEMENGIDYLENKGLSPYAITQSNDVDGKWYHIIIGAEKSLEDVLALKMKLEDNFGLNALEVQNYNKLHEELIPLSENEVDNYPASWTSLDLLLQLPHNPNFQIRSLKSLSYFDDINVRSNSISRNIEFDYPRGIIQRNFKNNVDEIVEGKYVEPFSKTELTIHLVKLKEKNDYKEGLSKAFSERILKSKRYKIQKSEEIVIDNDWQMNGYQVTINPKELRSYLVLESASGLLLALIQSNKNDVHLLKSFAKNIGDRHAVDEYNSVKRLLGSFPDALNPTERMIAFDFTTKDSRRGKTALLEVGQTQLSCYFENSERGTLVYQLENFNDENTIDKIFRNRYSRYLDDPNVEKVLLGNRDAFFYKTRRRNPETRKLDWMLESVIFQNSDNIGKISNFKKGTFEQEEMLEKLASFRLGDDYQMNTL